MDKDILATLWAEFDALIRHLTIFPRHAQFSSRATEFIQVAIGMRRVGKTYFILHKIQELLKTVPTRQIVYINFEDERLLPLHQKEFGALVDQFYALFPENHDLLCYFFFDEIQNVDGWPLVVRRLLDTKKCRIFLTGSSAKLLSKEIATSLRGRSLAIEIDPLSFAEFLEFHHLFEKETPFSAKKRDVHLKYLQNYLETGGFPAIQFLDANEKRDILQNYVDAVVFRDVIERYNIVNHALIKYLIKTLLKNCAAPFSVNKFFKDVKSQGYSVAKDTLYHYIGYIEDAFLIFLVPLFSESHRKREVNPKKIYAVDTGLVFAHTLACKNLGPLFENLVYMDLRRQGAEIYYYKTEQGYEVDFVAKHKDGSLELLQVTWDATDKAVMEREKRALEKAENELGIKGRIIDPVAYLKDKS